MSVQTESEKVFERYLQEHNLVWSRIPTSNRPQADYKVQYSNTACLVEVKEFNHPTSIPSGPFTPLGPIRNKIRKTVRKFRGYNHCCTVVLWNSKNIFRSLLLEAVASAAFGDRIRRATGSAFGLDADPASYQFSHEPLLTPKRHNTISAIIILTRYQLNHQWLETWRLLNAKKQRGEQIAASDQFDILQSLSSESPLTYSYEGTIRAIVLENPHARVPLPVGLFAGPFDQRWGMEADWFSLAFMGSELAHLKHNGVPFIYL
jgi:hypothetical protein